MRRRRPYHRLHPDFVEAVRARYRADRPLITSARELRRTPWHRYGYVFVGSDPCHVVARQDSPESRRLQILADAIGYVGLLLDEEGAP